MRKLLPVLLLLGWSSVFAEPKFLGEWVINHELTEKLAPEYKDATMFSNLGQGSVSVSVMGVPLPKKPKAPATTSGARDPEVLMCSEMRIEAGDNSLELTYKGVGSEVVKKGSFRGRKTSWTNRSIKQTYKTTKRKVKKTWEMRSDGRLLVTVIINPNDDKKRTFKRVFDRAPQAASSSAQAG